MILRFFRFVLSLGLVYQYFLLAAGALGFRRKQPPVRAELPSFAVLVPAHNEEEVIGATVGALRALDYAPDRYEIHVVADHCSDRTAQVAAAAGAVVHVRTDEPHGRKGYALDWLIRRVLADKRSFDAIAIFDADSRVDPGFLRAAAALLADGAMVVQGQHIISNPEMGIFAQLADADMRLNNLLRNQAKEVLGLSARLMGDGMVLRRGVLAEHPWSGIQSLTEDRDYGLYLVTQGVRIRYTYEARSYGQAAPRWQDATPQRLRWYGGAFDLQKRYLGPLTTRTLAKGSTDALDKLLELVLPPFSLLAAGSAAVWVWGFLLRRNRSRRGFGADTLRLALAVLFPVAGLAAARAPARCYRALLAGPVYVAWRLLLVIRSRIGYRRVSWVRTRRSGS